MKTLLAASLALLLVAAPTAAQQTPARTTAQEPAPPATQPTPGPEADFTLEVWAYFDATALEEFAQRVQRYLDLRETAQQGLPPRQVTRDPAEVARAERALAERIQQARADARQGEIFVPPIESGIKRLLVLEVDSTTMAAISEGNPGEFDVEINSTYPDGVPLSTVPPNVLALLPRLGTGLEYRFVGRHLILRDSTANVVIDHIPYAIECTDCAQLTQPPADGDDVAEEGEIIH